MYMSLSYILLSAYIPLRVSLHVRVAVECISPPFIHFEIGEFYCLCVGPFLIFSPTKNIPPISTFLLNLRYEMLLMERGTYSPLC